MPAFSAGATYLIGKVFIQHFASGGTLLDFNPPDYREFIKAQKVKLDAQTSKLSAQAGNSRPVIAERHPLHRPPPRRRIRRPRRLRILDRSDFRTGP
jgi:hypothetical protein